MTQTTQRTPGRRALLIGIDSYPLLAGFNLEGCVQDALSLANLLRERFLFAPEDVVLLLNEQATRDRILSALEDLAQRTGPDDVVVVHYSGHGSQVPDKDGDEGDGLDETLVAADSGRGRFPNRDVLDDELAVFFRRISAKTPYLTVILDCCHSGTGTRDLFGARSRGLPPDLREGPPVPPHPRDSVFARKRQRPSYAFIGGCRDEEKSYEYQERTADGVIPRGALSYFLHRELATVSGQVSLRTVFERAARRVSELYPTQHPQAEGELDRAVFGTERIPALEAVGVGPRTGGSVLLQTGVLHGATAGSTFQILPSRESTPAEALGSVEIERVSATTSIARIIEESRPAAIAEGSCARELRHAIGEPGLAVEVAECAAEYEGARAALLQTLSACANLRLTGGGSAIYRIYALGPRHQAAAGNPVPQLGALDEPVWAVVERDGELALPALSLTSPRTAEALSKALRQLARRRALLLLENPGATSSLQGAVRCEVLAQRGPEWQPIPLDASGEVPLEEGTRVAVRITNGSPQPVYPFLFYVGIEGSIDLLFPSQTRWEQWFPGRSVIFGNTDEVELRVALPEDFPFYGAPKRRGLVGGTGYLKLLATQRPVDLGAALNQGSVLDDLRAEGVLVRPAHRDLDGAQLDELLSGMLSGARNLRLSRPGAGEDFATVTLPLFMYRPDSAAR